MKVFRVLYWAAIPCTLLFGLYTGNRFLWMVFLTLTLLMLAALGINIWTICSFSYVQELDSGHGEKGQSAGLHIGIYNDKPFPFTHMRVKVEAPAPQDAKWLEINLSPRDRCAFDLELPLRMRGEYRVGMTRLELQDVFGLLPMHIDLRRLPYYRQKSILVLPRVLEIPLPAENMAATGGSGVAALSTGKDELSYLRSWQPGDKLSRVHWQASAKARELVARQYEDPAGSSCLIFLDCRTLPEEDADKLVECTAALAYAHLKRGDQVFLMCSRPEDPGPGRAFGLSELTAIREWLALLKFDLETLPSTRLPEVLGMEGFGCVYLLGSQPDQKALQALAETSLPGCYWVSEPLNPGMDTMGKIRMTSMSHKDAEAFLAEELAEWGKR